MLAPAIALGADYALTEKNTTVTFVGSKKEGKHEGGFKSLTGTATVTGNDLTTLKVTIDIDMNSLFSDNDKLTGHLKSPDFFGVKSNPKSKFVSTKVEKSGDDYKVTGDFTMLGKTKSITFPAKLAVTADGLTVASTFTIDRTQWGMTFGPLIVGNSIDISLNAEADAP